MVPCSGVSSEFRSSSGLLSETHSNYFFHASIQWGQDSLISFLMSVVLWQYSIQCNMPMVVRPKVPIINIIRFSRFCSSGIPYFVHITGLIRKALWSTVHIQQSALLPSVHINCYWEMFHKNVNLLWCCFLSKHCPEPHIFPHWRTEQWSCIISETGHKKATSSKRQKTVSSH